jgi:DNA sulfur modification protein DndC
MSYTAADRRRSNSLAEVCMNAVGASESATASVARVGFDLWPSSANLWTPVRREIAEEYALDHDHPWIIGFSGGKDSTLVCHLVFEHLLSLPPSARCRPVHIVSNDTLVESPLVITHIRKVLDEIRLAAEAFAFPIHVKITRPDGDQTFWVSLIGRGYPSPNRSFRWCTDRMKILPTSRYIREQVNRTGQVILLLGVRRDESSTRAGTVARYDNGGRLNRHNDLVGCMVFRPIVDIATDDVWEFLGENRPPWGGSHAALIELYRNASGGECPVVTQKSDAPSCGTSSSRFGCWTCTVVEKDKSLEGFVEAGFAEFAPLIGFRDWLASIRNDPRRRMARRRDGRITVMPDGTYVPGPYMIDTRAEILDKLLTMQAAVRRELISDQEILRIKEIWAEDALVGAARAQRRAEGV